MKNNIKKEQLHQTAEQLYISFLNETNYQKKNITTEFSIWWIKQSTQVDINIWTHGSESIINYLEPINTLDSRIAKAILTPFKTTYNTFNELNKK